MTLSPYNIPQQLTSVMLATGNNLIGSYYNGISNNGVGATLIGNSNAPLFVDSTLANKGDRVLLTGQTNSGQNGIYDVVDAGSSFSPWKLQRSNDFQSLEQIKLGQFVSVNDGATLKGAMLVIVSPLPTALGGNVGGINFANVASGSGPSGPYLLKSANLSDVVSPVTSFQNLGTSIGEAVDITNADFTGGIYQIPIPYPNYVYVNGPLDPGNQVRLPIANVDGSSPSLGLGPVISAQNASEFEVADSSGNFQINLSGFDRMQFLSTNDTTPEGNWSFIPIVYGVNGQIGQVSLISARQTVYVANSGSDTVGNVDGSVINPYQTLSFALSQITDASASKPYEIILGTGVYTETNLSLKPWIYIDGQDSQITVSGSVTLDPSWSGGGQGSFENFASVSFPATVTLDFNSFSPPSSYFRFSNNTPTSSTTMNFVGDSINGTIVVIFNNFGFANQFFYNITNCYGALEQGASGDINIVHSSETAGGNFSVGNLTIIGNFTSTSSTAASFTLFNESCKLIGSATYSVSGSGNQTVFSKNNTFLSPPTLDNGSGGGSVIFNSDLLTALPILLNGATYSPVDIANSLNANISPSNYTPVDSSVAGNLIGIDNALGTAGSQSLQDTYDIGTDATINLSDGRPISINTISSTAVTNAVVTPSTGPNTTANYRMGGSVFNTSISINVTALQYLDATFTQPGTREVGIWVKSTGELLGSATIAKTDPLDGSGLYRTKVLDSPILLQSGTDYVVAATIAANETNFINQDAVPAAGITLTQSAAGPASSFPIPLTFPTNYVVEPNVTQGGFFQFSTFITNDSINYYDGTSDPTVLAETKSTTRASIYEPKMSAAQRDAIPITNSGGSVFVSDVVPPRPYRWTGIDWQGIAYLSDLPIVPTLNQGQLIIGVTASDPVAGDITSPNGTLTKDVTTNGQIKLDVTRPVPSLLQGQFPIGVAANGNSVFAGNLISSDSSVGINTSIDQQIDLTALIGLQQAYQIGSTITVNLSGGSIPVRIEDSTSSNAIEFYGDGVNPMMTYSGITNSTVPYSVLTDAQFSSLSSLTLGMIGFTTTSNRLSVYDGMSPRKLAYTDDIQSGTFTPSITNVSGSSALTFLKGQYTAPSFTSGSIVTCVLSFSMTATATTAQVDIASLPVSPAAFGAATDALLAGQSVYMNVTPNIGDGQIIELIANTGATSVRLTVLFPSTSGTKVLNLSFTYRI